MSLVPVREYTDAASMIAAARRRRAMFYPTPVAVTLPASAPAAERARQPKARPAQPIILRDPETRHNRPWTQAEITYLRKLVEDGKTIGALSLALRRTQDGVRGKCEALKLRVLSASDAIRQEPSLALASTERGQRVAAVINAVSQMTGVGVVDIKSDRRDARYVRARWIVAWLLRTYTPMSLPKIGTWLGGRDHTTVLHGCRGLEKVLAHDKALEQQLRKLGSEVRRLFEEQP